jgi:hypothetical protein
MRKVMILLILALTFQNQLQADNGYRLWLRWAELFGMNYVIYIHRQRIRFSSFPAGLCLKILKSRNITWNITRILHFILYREFRKIRSDAR